jgi:predicted RNA binding protein with dsRBD fold (UPF0201 family)
MVEVREYRLYVKVRPTEDRGRISEALKAAFPDMVEEVDGGSPDGVVGSPDGMEDAEDTDAVNISGGGKDITAFRELIRRSRIADAAGAHILSGGEMPAHNISGGEPPAEDDIGGGDEPSGPWTTTFFINKQALMMGKVHTGDGTGAMGDVRVTLVFERLPTHGALVDWLSKEDG